MRVASILSRGRSVLFVVALAVALSAEAQQEEPSARQDITPLFASHEPLRVSIEAPLTTLMAYRPDNQDLKGSVTFTTDGGAQKTVDLKIRTRGGFRREVKHCDFAPLRLNFRKKQVKGTALAGQNKLKLVTHCRNDDPLYEQLLLREYLAYRIFQLMTDKSYGVRLLQVDYIDNEEADPMTRLAFAIEDDDDVARRVGMKAINTTDITHEDVDRRQQNLINVFQYMIGNTEFSLIEGEPGKNCCHNSDLMSATAGAPFTPLPYDFDFAGLVNAPYAQANPRFEIESVRMRLYRGLCRNNELLPDTIQQFRAKKGAVFAIIDELGMLAPESSMDAAAYLNQFYSQIDSPAQVDARLIRMCR